MTTRYRHHTDRLQTPQSAPLPGQAPNSAGGYTWKIDDFARLRRFLVLGSDGGTYYASERKLTRENAECVERCIRSDGLRTVAEIVRVSDQGLAPKNDPALLALAMCAAASESKTRKAALTALPSVARIGTHLFHFAEFVEGFRGWGRALRGAVANWYLSQPVDQLALQIVKYQQRDGWAHRDLIRLSHPAGPEHSVVLRYAVKGYETGRSYPAIIEAMEQAKTSTTLPQLIRDTQLPRECIPTEALQRAEVWDALLDSMPLTAMLRNLGKMTQVGLLAQLSTAESVVCQRMGDLDRLRKARIHPFQILLAMATYQQGRGFRGSLAWDPNPRVLEALHGAFYESFQAITPSGKRIVIGIDVSGSMGWSALAGSPITARAAAAAMSMATIKVEKSCAVMAFGNTFHPLPISASSRLDDVVRATDSIPFGSTDCALPMLWAMQNKIEADAFYVYTDNETWSGQMHPSQALRMYRRSTGIDARLAVVGFTATGFSIADPSDPGMIDFVGFDASAPRVLASFTRGDL